MIDLTRLLRFWSYYKRGKGGVIGHMISFVTTTTIWYRLLIESIPILEALFPRLIQFAALFGIFYVFTSVILGYLDYKHGSVITEHVLGIRSSPHALDMSQAGILHNKAIIDYMNGDKEAAEEKINQAVKIFEKWSRREKIDG